MVNTPRMDAYFRKSILLVKQSGRIRRTEVAGTMKSLLRYQELQKSGPTRLAKALSNWTRTLKRVTGDSASSDLVANYYEEGDAGPECVDGDNERRRKSSHPPRHGVHDVLEGEGLLDVAGDGQDDEGRHDEDQQDALDHHRGRYSPRRVKSLGEVEKPRAQGRVDYEEDGGEGGRRAWGRISSGTQGIRGWSLSRQHLPGEQLR